MISLTSNGTSRYSVVLAADASPSEQFAAAELTSFVRQVTGAVLPIVVGGTDRSHWHWHENSDPKMVIVGKNAMTEELGLDAEIEALGDEGFPIRSVGDTIVIAGGRLRGTLYGVYEFLETWLGCRWYTPDVSNIPTRDSVFLPELNVKKTPAFMIREAFDMGNFDGDWAARNKCNGGNHRLLNHHGGAVRCTGVHTFNWLVPPEEYFDAHPEYFSEVGGVRIKENTQLCLTNPDVLHICIGKVREFAKRNPDCTLISLSQNDWNNWCTCPECKKIDDEEE